jgi:hypothetical protein
MTSFRQIEANRRNALKITAVGSCNFPPAQTQASEMTHGSGKFSPTAIRTQITGAKSKAPTTGPSAGRSVGDLTEDSTPHWYERVTGRMPLGRYIVTLCYATAVILLGCWPWNILLILPVLPSRSHNRLHFNVVAAPEASVWSKLFCLRGG